MPPASLAVDKTRWTAATGEVSIKKGVFDSTENTLGLGRGKKTFMEYALDQMLPSVF